MLKNDGDAIGMNVYGAVCCVCGLIRCATWSNFSFRRNRYCFYAAQLPNFAQHHTIRVKGPRTDWWYPNQYNDLFYCRPNHCNPIWFDYLSEPSQFQNPSLNVNTNSPSNISCSYYSRGSDTYSAHSNKVQQSKVQWPKVFPTLQSSSLQHLKAALLGTSAVLQYSRTTMVASTALQGSGHPCGLTRLVMARAAARKIGIQFFCWNRKPHQQQQHLSSCCFGSISRSIGPLSRTHRHSHWLNDQRLKTRRQFWTSLCWGTVRNGIRRTQTYWRLRAPARREKESAAGEKAKRILTSLHQGYGNQIARPDSRATECSPAQDWPIP